MSIKTTPFEGQKPGTSGLRKRVSVFQQPHYLENFVQSIFDGVADLNGGTLVLGGDGRFHNDVTIQTIIKMAAANKVKHLIVAQNGLLSTPAASHIIRKKKATGGIILSASHNPAGPNGDFGIKYNIANGGPAPESVTDAIFAATQTIEEYYILSAPDLDLSKIGETSLGDMTISIIDPVTDYVALMESLFDFDAIAEMIAGGFTLCFDAMHAITGPYAKAILEDRLGAAKGSVINGTPLPDFGGGHPDPNPIYAKRLFDLMFSDNAPDFGAASDGDGDRNIVLGRGIYVQPSDSLAVLTANAHLAPAYNGGIRGVARSMPTSRAVDRVADKMGIPCVETPTGWKFFGNLLDAGIVTMCGEESAGTSSNHIREKDGLWAVLLWLNILAVRKSSVLNIMDKHWAIFGRDYYKRFDLENVDLQSAEKVIASVEKGLISQNSYTPKPIKRAFVFSYGDPVDGTVSSNQGWCFAFEDGDRFVLRLSGTGTQGVTLRFYMESYKRNADPNNRRAQETALSSVLTAALQLTDLEALTGQILTL